MAQRCALRRLGRAVQSAGLGRGVSRRAYRSRVLRVPRVGPRASAAVARRALAGQPQVAGHRAATGARGGDAHRVWPDGLSRLRAICPRLREGRRGRNHGTKLERRFAAVVDAGRAGSRSTHRRGPGACVACTGRARASRRSPARQPADPSLPRPLRQVGPLAFPGPPRPESIGAAGAASGRGRAGVLAGFQPQTPCRLRSGIVGRHRLRGRVRGLRQLLATGRGGSTTYQPRASRWSTLRHDPRDPPRRGLAGRGGPGRALSRPSP